MVSTKLTNVPISLGANQIPGSQWRATFFVLEALSYHWLFGLPFLSAVGGEVLCAPRFLRFRLHSSGDHATVALPLWPCSDLPLQPIWGSLLRLTGSIRLCRSLALPLKLRQPGQIT